MENENNGLKEKQRGKSMKGETEKKAKERYRK